MPCEQIAPSVTMSRSPYVRTSRWCVTCKRPRPMAGTFGLWYGAFLICLGCGDSYTDDVCGTRHEVRDPRPFRRDWQRKRLESARRMWRQAAPLAHEIQRQRRQFFTPDPGRAA